MTSPHRFLRYPALNALVTIIACLDESWVRRRIWGAMQAFAGVFVMVTPGRSTSYQSACGTLFDWAGLRFGWRTTPDPAGLHRARLRLTENECMQVFTLATRWAGEHLRTVRAVLPGRQVLGVDGSLLHLPRSADLVRRFGVPKSGLGLEIAHYPRALLVSAWDIATRVPIAWTLATCRVGEREVLGDMLPQLPERCVLLLDRGYPARDLLGRILASGRDVVVRMVASDAGSWPEVAAFLASGRGSAIVEVAVGQGRKRTIVPMRLVRRAFTRGRPRRGQRRELMVVMTSLRDPELTVRDICRLYGDRWGVETLYRELKAIARIECWHGKTRDLINQEVVALMTWFTIAAVIAHAAEQAAPGPDRRANTRRVFDAVAYAMEALIMASVATGQTAHLLMCRANEAVRRTERWAQTRRPGRSAPRKALHPYARPTAK